MVASIIGEGSNRICGLAKACRSINSCPLAKASGNLYIPTND